MSEWDGHLRVATTAARRLSDQARPSPRSTCWPNATSPGEVGSWAGSATGERIYAVRFVGPIGYVVTFRQTDPLYTVDLSDPTAPRSAAS